MEFDFQTAALGLAVLSIGWNRSNFGRQLFMARTG